MHLYILGCRGVPAQHGGFETFAEQFALYMVGRGHRVTVACQGEPGTANHSDYWRDIKRDYYAAPLGPRGTILFDLKSAAHASKDRTATILTLGYNTAIFSLFHRIRGTRHFMNMDGVEWRREKWSGPERLWLRANEFLGAKMANRLIADHPAIKAHLSTLVELDKISVIPYGADAITSMPTGFLEQTGLKRHGYDLVIARPEPENSLLQIVKAHAAQPGGLPLVILGRYLPLENAYHAQVLAAAKDSNVLFLGAIYDQEIVKELRFHARLYIHGHQVGGTNPSLIESLAAGNAIVAHGNTYNQWVAGTSAKFFSNVEELREIFVELSNHEDNLIPMREGSVLRHQLCFRTEMIMEAYENCLQDTPVPMEQWRLSPDREIAVS